MNLFPSNNFQYKKSLSQHFLHDFHLLQKIPSYLQNENSVALEIGAGSGNLTSILIKHFPHLIAIEKDHRLIPILDKRCPNAKIYEMDFLSFPNSDLCTEIEELGPIPLFSNLPYQYTAKFLSIFAQWSHLFSEAVILIQKEVADKLLAPFPSSYLTALIQSKAKITKIKRVPKESFHPKPQVESTLVHLSWLCWDRKMWKRYQSFLSLLFERKRKQLFSSLRKKYPAPLIESLLQKNKLKKEIRAENIKVEQLIKLFFSLGKLTSLY